MVFPLVPLAAALWEMHKGGPPDSFANSRGDQSPDATAARNRINDLARSNSEIGYQPSRVPSDAYKDPASLDNLYDRIQKMDLNAATTFHATWEGIRNKLAQGHNTFGPAITKALVEKWKGAAGQQAASGVSDFLKGENDLVVSVQLVAEKLKLTTSAMEIAKPGAQPAPRSGWTSDIASWVPGPTWQVNDHRKTEADTANEHLVNNVFYPAIRESDSRVPLAPQPNNPINPPAPVAGPGPATGPGPASGPGPSSPGPGAPGNGAGTQSGTSSGTGTTPSDVSQSSTGLGNTPGATTTSAFNPTAAATAPSSLSGLGGLGGGDLGGLGGGELSGGPGGSAGGGPGFSVPGAGKGMAASALGAPITPGPSGAMSPMGGMGGMGGKGQKEEEKTHKSKISEALVSQDNGDELTGLGRFAKKTVPQTLGEDAQQQGL